jgi:hypothetical protein
MNNKKNMEGCQMNLAKNGIIEDVKSGIHVNAFMTVPIC